MQLSIDHRLSGSDSMHVPRKRYRVMDWLPAPYVMFPTSGCGPDRSVRDTHELRGARTHDRLGGSADAGEVENGRRCRRRVGSSALMGGWPWSPGVLAGSVARSPKDSARPGLAWLSRVENPTRARKPRRHLRSAGIDATGIACHMGSLERCACPRRRHRGTLRCHRRRGQQRCECACRAHR